MDLRRLTLHQLRVFRLVAQHLSFTRAAAELGLTQSAVSAQIRSLTSLLGVPLLEQLGKRIHVTRAGHALLDHATRADAMVREIGLEFVALQDGEAGSVRVGASTSIGTYYFPPLISDFSQAHPGIDVSLEIENTNTVQERLLRNDFDVAYIGGRVDSPDLVAAPFLKDKILWACAQDHPLALALAQAPVRGRAKRSLSPGQLQEHKVIVREPGSATRRTMEAHCAARGVSFQRVVQYGSVEAIKHAVEAGLGLSYFSELTIRRELASGRLVRLSVKGLSVTRTFYSVLHRQKRMTTALSAFQRFASQTILP